VALAPFMVALITDAGITIFLIPFMVALLNQRTTIQAATALIKN
jgi:hypothetical protein